MYTNLNNLPLSISVWLADSDYDLTEPKENEVSATTLLKPLKALILANQNKDLIKSNDISDQIALRYGSAIHNSIESVWVNKSKLDNALTLLGTTEKIKNRIIINPDEKELLHDSIPVYLEQRVNKKVGKYSVSGKYDFVIDGELTDFKTTGVFKYLKVQEELHGLIDLPNDITADELAIKYPSSWDYIMQGSIYKWLNPELITQNLMNIVFIFTDWSAAQAMYKKEYPKKRIIKQRLPLLSISETEKFINKTLESYSRLLTAPQEQLPECTSNQLWRKPPIWKYYKNPDKTSRATANFNNSYDASMRLTNDGNVGIVKEIQSKPTRCLYCPVFEICNQGQSYVADGSLPI